MKQISELCDHMNKATFLSNQYIPPSTSQISLFFVCKKKYSKTQKQSAIQGKYIHTSQTISLYTKSTQTIKNTLIHPELSTVYTRFTYLNKFVTELLTRLIESELLINLLHGNQF